MKYTHFESLTNHSYHSNNAYLCLGFVTPLGDLKENFNRLALVGITPTKNLLTVYTRHLDLSLTAKEVGIVHQYIDENWENLIFCFKLNGGGPDLRIVKL